jgi:hypothetical protein
MPDQNDRRARVIDALTAGVTVTAAARQCGVARRTVCYWLKDPAFQTAIAERRREVAGRVADELTEIAMLSVRVLKAALREEEDEPRPKDSGPRSIPAYGRQKFPTPFQVTLAKELVLGMGLMAVRPPPKDSQHAATHAMPPRLEGGST